MAYLWCGRKKCRFSIKGVENPSKIEHEFLNTLNGEKFNIKIRVDAYKYNFEDKIILAFYIPISKQKPVYYNSLANSFIRSGSADYFSPIKSRVRVFSDKIEFFNAGSYPKPIEYFLNSDTSMPRNPILAKLFRAVKLAENAGYGFDKMIDGWKSYTSVPIEFQTDLDTSLTTFHLEQKATEQAWAQVHLSDTERKILKYLKNENISSAELVQKLGLKSLSGGLKNSIKHLLEIGLIELTLPDKPKSPNQKYKIKDK